MTGTILIPVEREKMKVLTKNTDYAVRALLELAFAQGDLVSAKEISDKQKIPYEFLRKILSRLIKEKIVISKEGGSGGFQLRLKPSQIKLSNLIQIFQGEVQISECLFRDKICPNRKNCVLRQNILQVERKVVEEFNAITIESLMEQMKGRV
jgi:Rrf2 family protein